MIHHHNTKAPILPVHSNVCSAERLSGIQQASVATRIPTIKTRNIGIALSRTVRRQVTLTGKTTSSGIAKKSILQ
jgi:hypothetical protein